MKDGLSSAGVPRNEEHEIGNALQVRDSTRCEGITLIQAAAAELGLTFTEWSVHARVSLASHRLHSLQRDWQVQFAIAGQCGLDRLHGSRRIAACRGV